MLQAFAANLFLLVALLREFSGLDSCEASVRCHVAKRLVDGAASGDYACIYPGGESEIDK